MIMITRRMRISRGTLPVNKKDEDCKNMTFTLDFTFIFILVLTVLF